MSTMVRQVSAADDDDFLAGLDVVKTKLVKDVKVISGIVTVFLELPRVHQFANNVKNEISERIEPLWDVKEVKIIFQGE